MPRGTALHFAGSTEALESRQLLTPIAYNDSSSVLHDRTYNSDFFSNVLSNDNSGWPPMPLTAVQVTGVSHGSLTLNSNGSYSYTPTAGYVGSDSFTYKAYDGTTYSSPATVTINVTNTAPTGTGETYAIYKDSMTFSGSNGVLYNDSDMDWDTLTANLVTNVSHGTLTLNSNGSFTYAPTANYQGTDSFVYRANDGASNSSNITVTLNVGYRIGDQTNSPNTPFNDYSSYGAFNASQLTGGTQVVHQMAEDHTLVYSSLAADVKPIVVVEAALNSGGIIGLPNPDDFKIDLTFGGLTLPTIYFNNSGFSSSNGMIRLAAQIDASSLATGHYQYQMTVTAKYGSDTATHVYSGYQDIVNRQSSEFGKGWSLAEQDGLAVQTGGVLWYGGAGGTAWFASNGSGGYISPAGPLNSSTLVLNGGGTYTLTDKYGNAENFSSTGLLTSRADKNGNTFTYAYSSGKLSTITDPYSRTTTFNYTSGLVSSISDIASNSTGLTYTSGKLTRITAPDPDAGGVLTSPQTNYAYTGNLLTTVTDALSHATTIAYSYGNRISGVTFSDTSTNSFTPLEMVGLVNPAGGVGSSTMNRATPTFPNAIGTLSMTTDAMSYTSQIKFDQFGNVTSYTDPGNRVTTNTYNANGQLTQTTQPSPNGIVAAPVTAYQYDAKGNLTRITYPDTSYETWTYHSTLNMPLTHTDQRGKTTTYTLDADGNILTITDALSNVTTLTYNADGTIATVTAPDPDAGGALAAPVTSYTYDTKARVTRITNPDTTHRDFTYDTADNVLTVTNELGWVITATYDKLNRLLTMTDIDPDGAGGVASSVTTYGYNAMSYVTSVTDALGKVTSYTYNTRDWLLTETLPDPDGAGALAAPVTTYGYNANGWRTTVTDPLSKATTYAYNSVGWVTSVTAPDPDGAGSLTSPVTTYAYDNLGRVTSVTDPLSHATTYGYNSLNQLTSVTDALSKATTYTYDTMGNVLTVTTPDPDGAGVLAASVTTYTYNDVGQLATETSHLGWVTTYAYDHMSRLTSVTDPDPDGAGALASPVTSYIYDVNSRITRVTDPLGYYTTYAYNNIGQVTSVTAPDPDGGGALASPVTSYTYDRMGRVTRVTDPNTNHTDYTYDLNSQITAVADNMGYVTAYAYDFIGRVTSRTDPDPDGAGALSSPVTTYTYDANSRITAVTDPRTNATTYAYDNLGRVTSVTQPDPDGGGALTSPVTSYQYDAASNVTRVTDPLGYYTQYAYDNVNRLTTVTQPDPDGAGALTSPVTTYTYDAMGRKTQISDPLSHTTGFAYDANSQLSSTTDALGNVTSFTRDRLGRVTAMTQPDPDGGGALTSPVTNYVYDANSRVTSVTDPLSHTTTYAYDNLGRMTSVTDALSHTTSFAYDAVGNRTRVTDALTYYTVYAYNANNWLTSVTQPDPDGAGALPSPVTTYTYDRLGRMTTVNDPNNTNTVFVYDANGNLTKLTDRVSNDTTYVYDTLNRVTSETDESSQTKSYVYDANSRLTSMTDKNSRVTNYGYDNLGRRTQEQWMSGGSPIYTATYVYDAASHLTSASDGNSAYAMTYNNNGLVTQIDNNGTATGPRVVINVGYDNLSRMTSQSATVSSTADFLNNYTYDAASRLTKITQQSNGGNTVDPKRVDFTYTNANQLSTVDRYANLAGTQLVATATWTYDNKGQATALSEVKGGTTLNAYTWTYDRIGRMTADSMLSGSVTDTYTYDAAGQVTAATHSGGGNESYSYDANGNRTNTGYTTTTDNKLTSDGTYNYTYDNEGNVSRKTTISTGAYVDYTWDYRNRLTDAKSRSSGGTLQSAVKYVYDVFNRLIEKQVDPTGGGTYSSKQRFAYDANNNVVLVYDNSNALTHRLLNGEDLNQHLAEESGSNVTSWYLTDRAGTVNDVIRYNSGTNTTSVVNHLTYGAFGNITAQTNSGNQPLFAYTGQLWDASTGLYYYHARWYNPAIGRFLSRDPLSFIAGDADLYRYVHNSPTNSTDPDGMQEQKVGPKLEDFLPPGFPVPNGPPTPEMLQDPVFAAAWTAWIAALAPGGIGVALDGPEVSSTIFLPLLQGGANTINGLQDAIIAVPNLGVLVWNGTGGWIMPTCPYIPSPDWSKNLVTIEDASGHGWGKFIGGQGAFTLVTLGTSQIGNANQLTHLTTPAAANNINATSTLLGKNGIYVLSRPASNPVLASIQTGGAPAAARILIPAIARGPFKPVAVVGPISAWVRWVGGAYYARVSSLNLATGASVPLPFLQQMPVLIDFVAGVSAQAASQIKSHTVAVVDPAAAPG